MICKFDITYRPTDFLAEFKMYYIVCRMCNKVPDYFDGTIRLLTGVGIVKSAEGTMRVEVMKLGTELYTWFALQRRAIRLVGLPSGDVHCSQIASE